MGFLIALAAGSSADNISVLRGAGQGGGSLSPAAPGISHQLWWGGQRDMRPNASHSSRDSMMTCDFLEIVFN